MDALSLFGMGYSWGGFESLVISFDCADYRTATAWAPGGPTLRFHIGLWARDELCPIESPFSEGARMIVYSSNPSQRVNASTGSRDIFIRFTGASSSG